MGGFLAPKYQMKKAMKIVEEYTSGVIPYDVIKMDAINSFKFDYKRVLLYLLELFKLEDAVGEIN
jgi:hypothetical protein